jgi:hypothetical protein
MLQEIIIAIIGLGALAYLWKRFFGKPTEKAGCDKCQKID